MLSSALLSFATGAPAATVRGTFLEKDGRTPLVGVEVVIRSAADSSVVAHAASAADGRVRLDSLRAGRYLLRASLLGHESYLRSDIGLADAAADLDLGTVELAVSAIALKGVETSTARATAILGADRNIYLSKDIPANTATELLRAVPELDVDINDRVSIRGSNSVTVQINGRKSPLDGDALAAFLRQFPASRIERVEVMANPSAKFDPEGMAGIVNIVTKEPLDLGLSGSTNLSLGSTGGGPGARVAWQQGRLTLYGGVNGWFNRNKFVNDDRRENLLAVPVSTFTARNETRNRGAYGSLDASSDFAFDKLSTLYATLNAGANSNLGDGRVATQIANAQDGIVTGYERDSDSDSDWNSGSATLGFTHVLEKGRNEWTAELRVSESPSGHTTEAVQRFLLPVVAAGAVSAFDSDTRSRDRSFQFDETFPLGKKGKVEAGYRGADRRNATRSTLAVSPSGTGGLTDYEHREQFHSGYLTVGSTIGKVSFQGGVRGEAAETRFDVHTRAARYAQDYRSVFPSANVAYDFGHGRTVRLTYSKRIERPTPFLLNPDVPAIDTLSRTVGNPDLAPKYTHSFTLDAGWSGSRGLLRLSPFFRETIRNWDQFRFVDAQGVQVTTWRNASAIRTAGASFTASLRQTKRLGGNASLSVYREMHDASNVSASARRDLTVWSLNGYGNYSLTPKLDLQATGRFSPAQTLAQGRIRGVLWMNVGARLKLFKDDKGWASLNLNDPFGLWKYEYDTSDASFRQHTTNHGSVRSVWASFGWSWGKPPETKQRKQTDDAAPPDPAAAGR
ncbi:MAG: TonB-dependent receptor [Candidatus Eisenbacteria bacterium]